MAERLVLIRHGEVDEEYKHCFVGSTDVSLSACGLLQARRLARVVNKIEPDTCYSSPMKRTLETSRLAGIEMPVVEPELREIDFGLWETMSFEQIRSSSPELVEEWAQYVPNFSFPGGEGIAEFVSRVQNVGDRLAACAGETVLAFTHGGVIRALICHFLGLSPRNYVLFDVKPCSMTTINLFDGKGVLAGLNDICHLEAN